MGAHDMYVSVGYGLLSYIRVDAPSHLRAPVMHAVAILHDVVGGPSGPDCQIGSISYYGPITGSTRMTECCGQGFRCF